MKCKCDYKQFRKYMKQLVGGYVVWLLNKIFFVSCKLYPSVCWGIALADAFAVVYTNYFYGTGLYPSAFMNPVIELGCVIGVVLLLMSVIWTTMGTMMRGGNK